MASQRGTRECVPAASASATQGHWPAERNTDELKEKNINGHMDTTPAPICWISKKLAVGVGLHVGGSVFAPLVSFIFAVLE
jgi:hypothetical protein